MIAARGTFALPSRAIEYDSAGAEYQRIEPGIYSMGEDREIPLEFCEPLAYMTRAELQKMFPYGDPARFLLSDRLFTSGDFDTRPVVPVRIDHPFLISATPVTNRQYEHFDPEHKKMRGKFGFSREDDDAVIYVSWHDAVAYCNWLSKKEGKIYRLPSEAEWEYAARAGTRTFFSTGDELPDYYLQDAEVTDFTAEKDKVSLRVGQRPPNPWGLYDMHGLVEEWVEDWYAPYHRDRSVPGEGMFKVTRGGSFGTFAYYLRSANRAAALPQTRGFTIGFRVACGDPQPERNSIDRKKTFPVKQRSLEEVQRHHDPANPYFRGPRQFVRIPKDSHGPLYHWHNHDTGIAECPNGDMLAIWYSCAKEQGRELSVAASRLEYGAEEWSEAYSFYDTPDRNDHCPALWFDGDETIYHLNGTALSHYWEPLQIVLRESRDSGVTWSTPRYIAKDFGLHHMVCQPMIRLSNSWLIFGADAHPDASVMWLSKDDGQTWTDTPGKINGIHASIVELKDGRLMALGRGNNIDGHMPMSISSNYGMTWNAVACELPPVTFTQRFSMKRLAEGPLAIATFLPDVSKLEAHKDTDRELAKLCICISYDDGLTWPVRRILSDDAGDHGVTGMSNGRIYMGPGNSEPTGYVSLVQARDGVIHVLSSINHYAFNLKWVESGEKNPSPMPQAKMLPQKKQLAASITPEQMASLRIGQHNWTNERTGAMESLDLERGFTLEARVALQNDLEDALTLKVFVRSGCTMCNRYWLRVNAKSAAYWYAGAWQLLPQVVPAGVGVYRMAVRDDTCVQIYHDEALLACYPASYEIGFGPPTRGNWMEWEISAGDRELTGFELSYDLDGPYRLA